MVDKRKSTDANPSSSKRSRDSPSPGSRGASIPAETRPPRKRKTPEEKDAEQKAKDDRKAKKEMGETWKASLVPWKVVRFYKHGSNVGTIAKGDAEKQYQLNNTEMLTLPYEILRTSPWWTKLYSLRQVKGLSRRRHGQLPTQSHAEAKPTQASLDWARSERRKYESKLRTSIFHWSPKYLVNRKPSGYTPPIKGAFDLTLPANFAFRTGRRYTELEAASLLLLHPWELEGLAREAEGEHIGETMSFQDVQQRAMDCHGGFEAHNAKIVALSARFMNQCTRRGYWEYIAPQPEWIELACSKGSLKDQYKDLKDKELLEVWWVPYDIGWDDHVVNLSGLVMKPDTRLARVFSGLILLYCNEHLIQN